MTVYSASTPPYKPASERCRRDPFSHSIKRNTDFYALPDAERRLYGVCVCNVILSRIPSSYHLQVARLTRAATPQVSGFTSTVLRRRTCEFAFLPAPGLHGDGTLQRRAGSEPADGGANGGVRRGARVLLRVRTRLGPPADCVQAR